MNKVVVIDKLPIFKKELSVVADDVVRSVARDALIDATDKAPFRKGNLRADKAILHIAPSHYRLTFGFGAAKKYARPQEFGRAGTRVFRNYTTSGTGAHFLRNAGDKHSKRLAQVFKNHSNRINV